MRSWIIRRHDTNTHHFRLLSTRRKRPCCRRAADERDDLAPSQSIDPHVPPRIEDRTGILPKMAYRGQGVCGLLRSAPGDLRISGYGTQETVSPAAGGSAY